MMLIAGIEKILIKIFVLLQNAAMILNKIKSTGYAVLF